MIKYLIAFLLISTAAYADCLQLDASTPHYTIAGINGSCDVAMTADEISAKAAADAAETADATSQAKTAAAKALNNGLVVISTSTAGLNGTYALDPVSQGQVNATTTYILLNDNFPGGGSTMPWTDAAGAVHVWPNVSEFKIFATAYASYVAAVTLYGASGGASGALPSNQVTIP